MEASTSAARRIAESQRGDAGESVSENAGKRTLKLSDFQKDHSEDEKAKEKPSSVETYRSDYREAYANWKAGVLKLEKSTERATMANLELST